MLWAKHPDVTNIRVLQIFGCLVELQTHRYCRTVVVVCAYMAKHKVCPCGKRLYACTKCTSDANKCLHGENKFTCKLCIRQRQSALQKRRTSNRRRKYCYYREVMRNFRWIEARPERLAKLKQDIQQQRVKGLSVDDNGKIVVSDVSDEAPSIERV